MHRSWSNAARASVLASLAVMLSVCAAAHLCSSTADAATNHPIARAFYASLYPGPAAATTDLRRVLAKFAGKEAQKQNRNDTSASSRNAFVFWLVVLGLLGVVIAVVIYMTLRMRRTVTGRLDDLRTAESSAPAEAESAE